MEEAKDIRELKRLLSGLAVHQDTGHSFRKNVEKAVNGYEQKIALLKSVSVLFFSLSLFLLLSLLFVLARNYRTTSSYHDARHTVATPLAEKDVPSAAAPVIPASAQAPAASPAVLQPDLAAAVVSPKKEDARTVVLKEEGGSLYFIAIRHYGKADETIYDLILQVNPAIVDVRKIDDQQKITLPLITAETYIRGTVQDGYRVYIGTFETSQWADMYAAGVQSAGKQVFIEPRKFSAQDTWYRLMIGNFNNKEEALQTVNALVKKGLIYLPLLPG